MSAAREQMWKRVYFKSKDVYGAIPDYDDHDARLTADAAVRGWYRRSPGGGYARRPVRGLSRMPNPGSMLACGDLLELEWVMPNGELRGCSFGETDGVRMLWSDSKQALYVLPFMRSTACVYPPRQREDQLARVWAKGRPAVCSSRVSYNAPPLPVAYPAIQISYRSDKFTHGSPMNYIHHFGPEVVAYFSQEPFGARRAPEAIMIRGGRLSLHSHGIDG